MMRSEPVQRAIAASNGVNNLARLLKISSASVAQWRQIPAGRVADVARITGIPAAELRPDLAAAFEQQKEVG